MSISSNYKVGDITRKGVYHSPLAISWHRLHRNPSGRPTVEPLRFNPRLQSLSSVPVPVSTNSSVLPPECPWSKGLYRAPSNLPELLVVVLCKRPHFVTIAPAGGRPPCYALNRGAERPKSTLHSATSPPVCSSTYAAPVEHVFSSGQDRSVCQRRTFP